MIVLDTDVVSELMRAEPDERVIAWVTAQPPRDLCTTAVSVAEVGYGVARLPPGRRRDQLQAAADDLFSTFADVVLPFDVPAAIAYAGVVLLRDRAGRPITGFDAQIASICVVHRTGLATRNTRDFEHLGLDVTDPWR